MSDDYVPPDELAALAGIADVPWSDLEHAYGRAADVPQMLRGLLSPAEIERFKALDALNMTILHQGTIYSSTAYAVPFLARIAALPGHPDRHEVIRLLESLATGVGYLQVHRPLMRGELPEAELDAREQEEQGWVRAATDALLREAGRFVALLSDADTEVRRAVPRLLANCHEVAGLAVPALARRLSVETDDLAATSMLLALGRLARWHAVHYAPENVPTAVNGPVVRLARTLAHALAVDPLPLTDADVGAIAANLDGMAGLDELLMWTEGDACWLLLSNLLGEQPYQALRLASAILQRPEAKLRRRAVGEVAGLVDAYRSATTTGIKLLANGLSDPDPAVRSAAASLLGDLAPASAPAADQLADVLEHDNGESRWRAAVALSRLQDPRVLPAIVEELSQPDPADWSSEALVRLGPLAAPLRDQVLDLLPRLPEPGRGTIGNRLSNCTCWLGSLGPLAAPAVPALASMLRQGRVQLSAANALVSLGSVAAPARAELAALPYAADPFLRVQGAMALWRIDGKVGLLLHVTDEILDRPRGATALALEHLAEVGPPAAPLLPRLADQLGHPDEWQCVPAARAVWRISGDPDLVAPVLVAAARPRPSGLLALETLVELPPDTGAPLTANLREWFEADRRQCGIGLSGKTVADDERLMALCRTLLGRLGLL